jgi:hypothetical protein
MAEYNCNAEFSQTIFGSHRGAQVTSYFVRKLILSGQLPQTKVGRRYVVSKASIGWL